MSSDVRSWNGSVIFLDFDGVLLPLPPNGDFDPNIEVSTEAIRNLNLLVEATGAVVVVSSAWREDRSVDDLSKLLKSWGFAGVVHDKTGPSKDDDRGEEIAGWLANNPGQKFVVIDDEPTDLEVLAKNLVRPKPDLGLAWHDVAEAIRILKL